MRISHAVLGALGAAAMLCTPAAEVAAQRAESVTAGSDAERYLRALQVTGRVPRHPWSVRGFTPGQLERLAAGDSAHPWKWMAAPPRAVRALPMAVDALHNSAFAYGQNDGPVWAGRGANLTLSTGFLLRAGALTARIQPALLWSANQAFDLMPNGQVGEREYADGENPEGIDLPQRFGPDPLLRVDAGQSTLGLTAGIVELAVSSANVHWGPTIDHPIILGTNAPGFYHATVGTSRPVNVGIGRVHGQLLWGKLEQSPYAPPEAVPDRLGTGLVAVLTPAGLPGLEVGVTRFFHIAREGGPNTGDLLRPLTAVFKVGSDSDARPENQLASVFARWVLPRAGVEVYGEYGRDDHNWDLLDFYLEPDHAAAYTLGVQHAWTAGRSLLALRGELLNSQASHLQTVRNQGRLYRHSQVLQGHTHRGQMLGSPAGYGGGGSVLALEGFTPGGRWSVDWTRVRQRDNWFANPDSAMTDVVHSLGGEMVWMRRRWDVRVAARAAYEMNRHFRDDRFNLTSSAGLRVNF